MSSDPGDSLGRTPTQIKQPLRAMAAEEELLPVRSKKLVVGYTLPSYAIADTAK